MQNKFFNIFKKTSLQRNLIGDFAWIAQCAETNAKYGYGISEIFRSNATANDLMELSGHRMEQMITLAAKIGWYSCARDKDQVSRLAEKFSQEAKTKGYCIHEQEYAVEIFVLGMRPELTKRTVFVTAATQQDAERDAVSGGLLNHDWGVLRSYPV